MAPKSQSTSSATPSAAAAAAAAANNKKRYVWPESLHKDFISAVFDVGLRVATVNEIIASVPELKGKVTDKDHQAMLQKLRVFRDRNLVPRPTYFEMENSMRSSSEPSGKKSKIQSTVGSSSSSGGYGGNRRQSTSRGNDEDEDAEDDGGEENEGGEEGEREDDSEPAAVHFRDNNTDKEVHHEDRVKKEEEGEEGDSNGIEESSPTEGRDPALEDYKVNKNLIAALDQTLQSLHIQLQQMAHSIQFNHQLYFHLQKLISQQHTSFLYVIERVNQIDPKLAAHYQTALQPFFFRFATISNSSPPLTAGYMMGSGYGPGNSGSNSHHGIGSTVRDPLQEMMDDCNDDDESSVDSVNMGFFQDDIVRNHHQVGELDQDQGQEDMNLGHSEHSHDAHVLLDSLAGRKVSMTDQTATTREGKDSDLSPGGGRKRSRSSISDTAVTTAAVLPLPSSAVEVKKEGVAATELGSYTHQHHSHQPIALQDGSGGGGGQQSLSFNYGLDHSHQHHHLHTYSHSHQDSHHSLQHDHAHRHAHEHAHTHANGGVYTHSHEHSHDANSSGGSENGSGSTAVNVTTGAAMSAGADGKLPLSTSRTELNIMYEMRAQMDFHRLLLMKKENQLSQLGGISYSSTTGTLEMNPSSSQQLSHQDTLDLMSADVSSVRAGGNQGGMMTTSSSTSSMGVLAAATMGSAGYSQGSQSNSHHGGGGQSLNLGPPPALTHTNSLGGDIVSDNMWDFELTAADLFSFLQDS